MEFLDTKDPCFVIDDTLLDFTLEDEEVHKTFSEGGGGAAAGGGGVSVSSSSSSLESSNPAAAAAVFSHEARNGLFPELVEEELEWLSNKEAFPAVETCFGILSDNPELVSSHKSPVSVLENSTTNNYTTALSCFEHLKVPVNFPVRARSKRRRRTRRSCSGDPPLQHHRLLSVENKSKVKSSSSGGGNGGGGGDNMGRRCLHCQADRTPQWRAGPMGPKTLCNACGVRYKSGRLLPEYRPANSPTFSSNLHSNSHRKVVEMRKQKHVEVGEEIVGGPG
ncbi:hypothetical protein ABFS83_07G057900 [Erythranthe nasuta]